MLDTLLCIFMPEIIALLLAKLSRTDLCQIVLEHCTGFEVPWCMRRDV